MNAKAFYQTAKFCFAFIGVIIIDIGFMFSTLNSMRANQITLIKMIDDSTIKCLYEDPPINETYCELAQKYKEETGRVNPKNIANSINLFVWIMFATVILGFISLTYGAYLDNKEAL